MPTIDWLRREFGYGYDSGNVLSPIPGLTRLREERACGGSYRKVFLRAAVPYLAPDSRVLELGAGRGSWTRAILSYLPAGILHVVDFQDVTPWLKPERYGSRLVCHRVENNSFDCVQDDYFDFFWSFGVLCHNNSDSIREILENSLMKMRPGGIAVHQYGDWDKLGVYGWDRGRVPASFQSLPDNSIWWPRNNRSKMSQLAASAGWEIISADLNLLARDAIIAMRRPLVT